MNNNNKLIWKQHLHIIDGLMHSRRDIHAQKDPTDGYKNRKKIELIEWWQQFYPAVTWDTNINQPSVPSYSPCPKLQPDSIRTATVLVRLIVQRQK